MKWPARQRPLSIFARTFLLCLTSLVLAECLGLALFNALPARDAPTLNVADIARALVSVRPSAASSPSTAPVSTDLRSPPGVEGGPVSRDAPSGPPPDNRYESLEASRRSWSFRDADSAPARPANTDEAASERLRAVLAARIGDEPARVRLYVQPAPWIWLGAAGDDSARLRRGFVAAWQRTDGRWRVLDARAVDLPDLFTRQSLLLFALGLVILVPLSWLFARALAAPIDHFAAAARRLGTDPHPVPLEHHGPAEMSVAIDAFNTMQGRLARLLQERSLMVGAIAHDLRTPLARLAFRIETLDSPLKEKIATDLQQMQQMIAATLDFVREQSLGGMRERLDFGALVESVVDDQHDVGHDVVLQASCPVIVHGDPLALRRAVSNLVDNALKYGERARLQLRADAASCTLDIDDEGPGIPEALQARVFEPFFRTEVSRNRATGGIGLGLTTVRGIVLDHGGTIELHNRKPRGLRVRITLPLPDDPAARTSPRIPARYAAATPPGS